MSLRRLLAGGGPGRGMAAAAPTPDECRRFRGAVGAALGLQLDSLGERRVAEVLGQAARDAGTTVGAYLDELEAHPTPDRLAGLARELTVGETYFFRHVEQFDALRGWIAARRARDGRPIRVLSAGCASGEEPYSIAMVLRDAMPAHAWTIRAVDVNPAAIAKARRARYTRWALRSTPPALPLRWLHEDGPGVRLDDAIRGDVAFEQRNLCADDAGLWAPGAYDVIFCRNVLMHLARPAAEALALRLASSLAPGGALFLGHAETLRGVDDVVPREAHGAFWYERVASPAPVTAGARAGDAIAAAATAGTPAGRAIVATAITGGPTGHAIAGRAAHAVTPAVADPVEPRGASSPSAEPPAAPPRAEAPPAAAPAPDALAGACELLREERFGDALAAVQALPAAAADEPQALLLRGVLLAHGGDYARAERIGLRLVQQDESDADAYHLVALCRQGRGDRRGALDCERRAVALDPGFALARMHLGLMARRAGDRAEGRRQFGRAVALLAQESEARLALFGGGFGRAALLAMNRAELLACGEPA